MFFNYCLVLEACFIFMIKTDNATGHLEENIDIQYLLSFILFYYILQSFWSFLNHDVSSPRVWNYEEFTTLNSFGNHDLSDRGISRLCLVNEFDDSLLLVASSKIIVGKTSDLLVVVVYVTWTLCFCLMYLHLTLRIGSYYDTLVWVCRNKFLDTGRIQYLDMYMHWPQF